MTPLMHACRGGHVECAQQLLDAGAKLISKERCEIESIIYTWIPFIQYNFNALFVALSLFVNEIFSLQSILIYRESGHYYNHTLTPYYPNINPNPCSGQNGSHAPPSLCSWRHQIPYADMRVPPREEQQCRQCGGQGRKHAFASRFRGRRRQHRRPYLYNH